MKDFARIWSSVTGRKYSSVTTSDRELRDLSHNRLKKGDIDTTTFEGNFSECESLNNKFDENIDFNERREAIINRLFEKRRKGQLTRQPKCLFIQLLLGFIALATGCLVLFLHPYDFLFKQKVILSDGGEIYEMWRKPEVDLYLRVYLFNITNAEEFMSGKDTKVKLKEVGPYVYKEHLEHEVTRFNANGTLTAIPRHPLRWVPELSEGNQEDDMLFLPHIALLSIANVVAQQSFVTRFGLNNLITVTKSQPLMRMTAREFMMGHKSNLMTLGNTFMPGWIYFDKLGLIDRMYDFDGDIETIFTGANDTSTSGLIDTYRGSTDLPQWSGKHCSNVQYASDGTKFKGDLKENETVLFYRKSLCRAAPLIPKKEGTKSGLRSYMYTFPDDLLDNGKHNEENKCFCRDGKCLPEGLIDVADCYYGFPIALSYPHFYQGDEVLSKKVEGLSASQEKHETRFWIQPESGLPLDVSAKFQINMALGDIGNINNCARFADLYLPLLWFDIRMYTLPQNMETRFRLYLNVLPIVERGSMYVSFIVGIFFVIFAIYRLTFKVMFKSFDTPKKQRNIIIGTDLWIEKEKPKTATSPIYTPCEAPLNNADSTTESDEPLPPKKPFIRSQSERFKVLSTRIGDGLYDSIGRVKDTVRSEITHVKNIFNTENRGSLIAVGRDDSNTNEAYKSDSGDDSERIDYKNKYTAVNTVDSEDDCKYLEVIDDGSAFDEPTPKGSRFVTLSLDDNNVDDVLLQISD